MNSEIHIIMVDDDEDDVFIMKRALARQGISEAQFQAILGGQEFVAKLNDDASILSHKNTIVLLDINMPRMDGFEVLQYLSNTQGLFTPVPVVMFSTSSQPQDISRSKDLGAADYFVKPRELSEFPELIDRIYSLAMNQA
jgi:CheY-like chemotaxis protein